MIASRKLWKGAVMKYKARRGGGGANHICDEMGIGPGPQGLDRPSVRVRLGAPIATATANYHTAGRPDIQVGVKEVCREVAARRWSGTPAGRRTARLRSTFPWTLIGRVAPAPAGRQAEGVLFCTWWRSSSSRPPTRPSHPSGEAENVSLARAASQGLVCRPWLATSGGSSRQYSTPGLPPPRAWRVARAWAEPGTSSAVFGGRRRRSRVGVSVLSGSWARRTRWTFFEYP